jgi:hypothetical protein
MSAMMLKLDAGDMDGYLVWVNACTQRVVAFGQFLAGGYEVTTVTVISEFTGTSTPATLVFVAPDPGSINGEERSHMPYSERWSRAHPDWCSPSLTLRPAAGMPTWTWDITDDDIQEIVALAESDAAVQQLLAQGAG